MRAAIALVSAAVTGLAMFALGTYALIVLGFTGACADDTGGCGETWTFLALVVVGMAGAGWMWWRHLSKDDLGPRAALAFGSVLPVLAPVLFLVGS